MDSTNHCFKNRRMKKIMFGLLLLIAGSLLLAFNFEVLPIEYKHIIFSWPMLLIAIGIVNFFSKESYIGGSIMIIIGGYFLALKFFPEHYNILSLYWPVLLIVIGITIILKKSVFNFHHHNHFEKNTTTDTSYIEEVNIFGGNKHNVNAPLFKGGKVVNIFGGSHIDLTKTNLDDGKNTLEIVCVFGGIELIIPSDWIVHIEVASVLGGFGDKRVAINSATEGSKELYIKGVVVFGGGEIKSYG